MEQKNGLRSFENIAKLIRTSRVNHEKSYSQSELSHLLGYKNGQFISNVERALCNIPFKMLNKVCEILNISEAELKQAILKDYEETIDNYFRADNATATTDDSTEANRAAPANLSPNPVVL